ncbi:PEP-CTERM sorting domain-containing protein [Enterovibrio paralichthyis]|uniref:PEP-CTERM sorting domain-containing protein n=1 Tax=Enterovibrio paralichthyis TaxID=2853805 RepID=UPI001C46C118|nr:PEP-CTERM sorting domain-containing protein [Enterovibrio paralichthyis]MBV7299683.1 PEP-CTERM sorting domain-containing protein [Enterovibrio paralichthyis]
MRGYKFPNGLIGLAFLSFTAVSNATPITAGDSVLLPGTTVVSNPELAGTVVRDDLKPYYDLNPDLHPLFIAGHHYQDRVVQSDVTGSLIFASRLRDPINVTGRDFLIDSIVLDGYSGFQTDVFYRTDGLGDRGPTFVERSADGDDLTFLFGFPLLLQNLVQEIQDESLFINILTDATAYNTSGTATIYGRIQDGANAGQLVQATVEGIAVPTRRQVKIPEPSTLVVLLSGMALLTVRVRRHSKS